MERKDNLRIAAVQMNADERDKSSNLDRMEDFVVEAARQDADIVSFPEICITGYNFILYTEDRGELMDIAEPVPDGDACQRIKTMAKENNIVILFGLLERDGEKLFNTYVCVRPDGSHEKYRKIHAFENSHISQGDSYPVFDLFGWKCGTLICFDNNLPENPRVYSLAGCELLFAPHQTGGFDMEVAGMGRIDVALWDDKEANEDELRREFMGPKGREWIVKWLPSRAYDNNMFYVFTNGVGLDHDELRTGNAMILDPNGVIISESYGVDSDMIIADCAKSARQGTLGGMHIKTRRPDLYGPLTEESGDSVTSRDARNSLTVHSHIA